jgi:hypothetical protein
LTAKQVADVVAYLCARYPHKSELSNARLTKLVYLADWKSVQDSGSQVTSIEWVFNNYGPWVPDVIDAAGKDNRFKITTGINAYGSPRTTVTLKPEFATAVDSAIDARTSKVLDLVIAETEGMYFNPFIRYVYDTFPVRTTPKGAPLPLESIAGEHPEARAPLPHAVLDEVLTAEEYVFSRNQLMQSVADRLFDSDWLRRTDPRVQGAHDALPGLTVRAITLDPDLQATRTPEGVSITTRGTIDAGAEVAPGAVPPTGYTVDEEDSDAWSNTVRARLPLSVEARLLTKGTTRSLRLTAVSVRLAA